MRILSWNINGIRTLPQYHPWNTLKTCEGILDELHADIICFQEMKSSRSALQRDVAVPDSYQSFFSFPSNKGGYSGIAVYVNARNVLSHKAEEGLSGRLQPKVPLSTEERVSHTYPTLSDIPHYSDEEGNIPSIDALDAEGRALVLDFGLFVLISVYCPNETDSERLVFKMNYHAMLQERVRILIEDEHREVIVCGDLNICATPMDHPEGHLPSFAASFFEHPARIWFRKWLDPEGPMVDVVRSFWPDRKGLYTCWNQKLAGRESNYGSRVDYFLVTRGLLPWIKHGDIQPSIKGSDHCPMHIDLHDEIELDSGEKVLLRDAMKQDEAPREAPRIAAKYWEEHSGKQTMLSSFFGKKKQIAGQGSTQSPPNLDASPAMENDTTGVPLTAVASASSPAGATDHDHPKSSSASRPKGSSKAPLQKRKSSGTVSMTASKKRKKSDSGQAKLASFFKKPSASSAPPQEVIELADTDSDDAAPPTPSNSSLANIDQLDADYRLACELSAADDTTPSNSFSSSASASNQSKTAWSDLFAPLKPPNCTVHSEPTKLWTVNKPGPNKGKKFYLCSRPVGPGWDKGRAERLREEVNNDFRCDYFKWASEVKKEALREKSSKPASEPP